MTDVLDIVGLIALAVSGFLLALWLGFAVTGAACLAASYTITRKRRQANSAKRDRALKAAA